MSGFFLCTSSARPFQTLVSSGVSDHIDHRNSPEVLPPPPQAPAPSKPTPARPAPLILKKSRRFIALPPRTADDRPVPPSRTRRPETIAALPSARSTRPPSLPLPPCNGHYLRRLSESRD